MRRITEIMKRLYLDEEAAGATAATAETAPV